MELRMKGWVEIDRVVVQLILKIESHRCGCSFCGKGGPVYGSGLVKMADLVGAIFYGHSRDDVEP